MSHLRSCLCAILAGSYLCSAALVDADPLPHDAPASQPAPVALLRIEDDGKALRALREKLSALKSGRRRLVRVSHWGASHTAADVFTGELRARLQADFGDAGPGFVLLGKPWPSYRHNAVVTNVDKPWRAERLWARYTRSHKRPRDDLFGVAGVSVSTRLRRSAFVEVRRGTLASLDLYYLRQPRGGKLDVVVGGKKVRTVLTGGRQRQPAYALIPLPPGTRRVDLHTRGRGEVRLFGADVRSGQPGVLYDTLGLNGARASAMLNWNQSLLAAHLSRMAPDLVVVAYGGNDVDRDDLTRATFAAEFGEMLTRLRRMTRAACLVLGPPDRGKFRRATGWEIPDKLDMVIDEERRLARQQGCAFWDQRAAMGGAGSVVRWLQTDPPLARADRVHFTNAAYRLFGEALYRVLLARP